MRTHKLMDSPKHALKLGCDCEGCSMQRLVRALHRAKQRALYWSGKASFTGKRFVPGRRGRKNHDLEYEMAMDDIENLSMDIERLTGKKLKRYDPRADEAKMWNALNARLVSDGRRKL